MLDIIFCFAISVVILILIYNKELGINNSFEAGYAFAEEQYSIYGEISIEWLDALYNPFEYNNFHLGVIHFLRIKTNAIRFKRQIGKQSLQKHWVCYEQDFELFTQISKDSTFAP